MSLDTMGAMLGMPSGRKKTRRGKRKSSASVEPKDPKHHLGKLHEAMDCDDHETARRCAFSLIRTLRASPPKSAMGGEGKAEEVTEEVAESLAPEPAKPATGGGSRLFAALKATRKA